MSYTSRPFPVKGSTGSLSLLKTATAYGSVSGDVTTITSIKLTQTADDWLFGIQKSEMPSTSVIDGVQYRWTVKSTVQGGVLDNKVTLVKEAVLNIGTKLTIRKPFFKVQYTDTNGKTMEENFSFYDLGEMHPYDYDLGASEFEIDGKTAVPIMLENMGEDSIFKVKLTKDATYRFIWQVGEVYTEMTKSYSLDKKYYSGNSVSASYTVPMSWNEQIKSHTYGWVKTTVQCIFGTQVFAEFSKIVKASVPDSCVPVINSIQIADKRGRVPSSWGMFVEENSNIALSAITVTKSYGSDISSVTLTVGGKTYSGTIDKLPQTPTLEDYGIMDITVTVKDGRGRTAQKTAKVTVVEYHPPTLQVDSMRCDKSGSIANEGEYFLAATDSTYSTCNGKNTATLTVQYKLSSATLYGATKALPLGNGTTICAGDLDTEFSYDVKYILKDTFNTVTVIDFVSTAVYAMHLLHGGRGVAFGSKATVENAVDFSFDAIFRGGVRFVNANGEEVTMQQILTKLGL